MSLGKRRLCWLSVAALLIAAAVPVQADWPTLAKILEKSGGPAVSVFSGHLSRKISSYGILRDVDSLIVAGYVQDEAENRGTGPLRLHVWTLARNTGEANHAVFAEAGLGGVLDVTKAGRFLLITLHHSPSASTELVLTEDLHRHGRTPGDVVTILDDRRVLLRRSQPHFAPTYSTELEVYDLETLSGVSIFPPVPPPPLRRELMLRVGRTYAEAGEDWCNEKNHHCDPQRLDAVLRHMPVYNAETDALAFMIWYDETALDTLAPSGRSAVYVYRGLLTNTIDYREVVVARSFDTLSPEELAAYLSRPQLGALFRSEDSRPL